MMAPRTITIPISDIIVQSVRYPVTYRLGRERALGGSGNLGPFSGRRLGMEDVPGRHVSEPVYSFTFSPLRHERYTASTISSAW